MRGKKVSIDEYLANLEPFLKVGCSLHEASLHACIPYRTVKDYYDKDENVRNKIDTWGNWDVLLARQSVIEHMQEDGKLSMDYLKNKKKDEFNTKETKELTGGLTLTGILGGLDEPDEVGEE